MLKAVARQAQDDGAKTFFYQTNLTHENEIADLSGRLLKSFDRIDVLVHSAGTIKLGKTEQNALEDFDLQYRLNVRPPYALTQALLPMLRSSQGQVVFINSS